MDCHDLEVMSLNSGYIKLGVCSSLLLFAQNLHIAFTIGQNHLHFHLDLSRCSLLHKSLQPTALGTYIHINLVFRSLILLQVVFDQTITITITLEF